MMGDGYFENLLFSVFVEVMGLVLPCLVFGPYFQVKEGYQNRYLPLQSAHSIQKTP
ncbi:putative cytochrome oxidase I [Roseibium sp. TrichSKD4]|nr:putative cytochrome oxidase I [Roseibium sp. TrichSKD4]